MHAINNSATSWTHVEAYVAYLCQLETWRELSGIIRFVRHQVASRCYFYGMCPLYCICSLEYVKSGGAQYHGNVQPDVVISLTRNIAPTLRTCFSEGRLKRQQHLQQWASILKGNIGFIGSFVKFLSSGLIIRNQALSFRGQTKSRILKQWALKLNRRGAYKNSNISECRTKVGGGIYCLPRNSRSSLPQNAH